MLRWSTWTSAAVTTALLLAIASAAGAEEAKESGPPIAASPLADKAIFVELGGPSVLLTANFEGFVGPVALRFGFGFIGGPGVVLAMAPVTVGTTLFPKSSSHLDLGTGVTVQFLSDGGEDERDDSGTHLYGTVFTGYRYQCPEGGFSFRVGMSALFPLASENDRHPDGYEEVLPLPYISFGSAFD